MYTPINPSFIIIKWGVKGYKSHGRVILMVAIVHFQSFHFNVCYALVLLSFLYFLGNSSENVTLDIIHTFTLFISLRSAIPTVVFLSFNTVILLSFHYIMLTRLEYGYALELPK